jgi:hypothetical protein
MGIVVRNTTPNPIKVLVWTGKLAGPDQQGATDGASDEPEIEETVLQHGEEGNFEVPAGGRIEVREVTPVETPFDD